MSKENKLTKDEVFRLFSENARYHEYGPKYSISYDGMVFTAEDTGVLYKYFETAMLERYNG